MNLCLYVCTPYVHVCSWRQEEGIYGSFGPGVITSYELTKSDLTFFEKIVSAFILYRTEFSLNLFNFMRHCLHTHFSIFLKDFGNLISFIVLL